MAEGEPPTTETTLPDHGGHRQRLRDRARRGGTSVLPDYEVLELILFRSIPQRDVKPLAKALLSRFGSLSAVLSAPLEDMLQVSALDNKGRSLKMTPDIALDLQLMFEATRRLMAEPLKRSTVISSWQALLSYLRVTLAHEPREQFRLLFLDKKNQLIADEIMNYGTVDHAPAYPREIMRRALELSASSVILVHNHPSGDPMPSQGDIDMTKANIAAGKPLKIAIHDHLIVGREGVLSMKQVGAI
ncbi:RadC family protein [Asticcacaulis excentricus]|uniref:DNA repair protein RadC n=1 Tax=Asticcacaulis excentricus (strain ATCC 15261 / DSM 4724 / KCTC 12464 / NCIMB 9791 / VKM B-1370 / CB 48) TaxID=573065 RepID=E8RT73_ASTEC|nr:DNA repair protein RadC [Asticcacaulis excentricus]ADU14694.1 DNA repair protein RadC [Asticcacaulis excentricus CB 48]